MYLNSNLVASYQWCMLLLNHLHISPLGCVTQGQKVKLSIEESDSSQVYVPQTPVYFLHNQVVINDAWWKSCNIRWGYEANTTKFMEMLSHAVDFCPEFTGLHRIFVGIQQM
ncbi:hypothetical protein C8J57DRAFT_1245644 [Mycena rebaudengoi]|nr:hypothetical protein C8J57DRAFT_1245644 [Mycena rebaudengoi]